VKKPSNERFLAREKKRLAGLGGQSLEIMGNDQQSPLGFDFFHAPQHKLAEVPPPCTT
jgi:hypothetical protein